MVKIEHCDEGDAASAGAGAPRGGAMDPRRPDPTRAIVKAEEELDSFSEKRLYLMRKMRFSKREVDLAFSELGEGASVGRLVDWIVTAQEATTEGQQLPRPIQSRKMAKVENCDEGDVASADAGAPRGGAVEPRQPDPTCAIVKVEASQNAGSQSSTSLGSLFNSDDEGNGVSSMPRIEASRDTEELDSFSKKRSYLLSRMSFSKKEVDSAFSELGEGVSIDRLVNWIVTAQEATTEGNAEFLPAQMDKLLSLLQMGFTQQEVSSAIEAFGQEATIEELADSIFARRFTDTTVQNQVIDESDFPSERETGYSIHHQRLGFYDDEDDNDFRAKKAKHECLEMTSSLGRTIRGDLAKPPYFLYADLVGISKDTWDQLSTFLFNIQPEYLNSQSFSALTRREGYVHNLPTERRHVLLPRSPMTIQGALPLTRKFWPSWDTRKQIAGVSSDAARGVEQIREKLEKAIKDSQGILSEGKQAQIVQQCKMASLVWIGQDKLGPLQPHQMEVILGYPPKHTDLPGLNPRDRVAAMEFAFQIDTLAHPLSVLKDLYPGGLRVLSIYSGVGGAEVALHRLGIPLRCVVSVEESAVNRRILKSWWGKTEQDGELRQLPNVRNLNSRVLEEMMKEFGGFDLVIGGNYRPYKGGTNTVGATMGMDSSHFFEYVRVVQSVRKHAGS